MDICKISKRLYTCLTCTGYIQKHHVIQWKHRSRFCMSMASEVAFSLCMWWRRPRERLTCPASSSALESEILPAQVTARPTAALQAGCVLLWCTWSHVTNRLSIACWISFVLSWSVLLLLLLCFLPGQGPSKKAAKHLAAAAALNVLQINADKLWVKVKLFFSGPF